MTHRVALLGCILKQLRALGPVLVELLLVASLRGDCYAEQRVESELLAVKAMS